MPDQPSLHQRTAETEAELIVTALGQNKIDEARVRLAEDYLTMWPADFNKVLGSVKQGSIASTKIPDIYFESVEETSKGTDVFLDDTVSDDTRLIGIFRETKPESTSLTDDNLERAARRYHNLLGTQTNIWRNQITNSDRKHGTDYAATTALINYAQSLPESRAAILMSRTEEINLELGRFDRAKLDVVMADLNGDGLPAEIKNVSLTIPFLQGQGGYRHVYKEMWNSPKQCR